MKMRILVRQEENYLSLYQILQLALRRSRRMGDQILYSADNMVSLHRILLFALCYVQ